MNFSVFENILTDRGSEFGILKVWKQEFMVSKEAVSIIVIPCAVDKKEP